MNSNYLEKTEKLLKRCVKRKVSLNNSTVVAFLITGGLLFNSGELFATTSTGGLTADVKPKYGATPAKNIDYLTIGGTTNGWTASDYYLNIGTNSNFTGEYKFLMGNGAGNASGGNYHLTVGSQAGDSNGGNYNFSFGELSAWNSTGSYNFSYGKNAGRATSANRETGNYNFSFGENAGSEMKGYINSSGATVGGNNVSMMEAAGFGTAGSFNTAIGYKAGQGTQGHYNYAFGSNAGSNVGSAGVVGNENVAWGSHAGKNVSGDANYAFGRNAGQNVNGLGNFALGDNAGQNVKGLSTATESNEIVGNFNFAFGKGAGSNVISNHNLAFGEEAGNYVGYDTWDTTTGAFADSARKEYKRGAEGGGSIGSGAEHNIAMGHKSGNNIAGQDNVAIGVNAGTYVSGPNQGGAANIGIGRRAGRQIYGDQNTAIGEGAGVTIKGSNNIAFGSSAANYIEGADNIAIGTESSNQTGSYVQKQRTISAGKKADATSNDAIAIGTETKVTNSTAAIAMGKNSTVDNSNLSTDSKERDREGAIAIGGNSKVIHSSKAIAIGEGANVRTNDDANGNRGSIAIGANATIDGGTSKTNGLASLAIGTNAIAGRLYDANNDLKNDDSRYTTKSGNLNATSAKVHQNIMYLAGLQNDSKNANGSNDATAIGSDARAIGDQSIAIGAQVIAGDASVAIGGNDMGSIVNDKKTDVNSVAYKNIVGDNLPDNHDSKWFFPTTSAMKGSVAIGQKAYSRELMGTAIGLSASVNEGAELGTAIGAGARVGKVTVDSDGKLQTTVSTKGGVAIAAGSVAESDYTTAIGTGTKALAEGASGIGYKNIVEAESATAIGRENTIANTGTKSVALGSNINVTTANSVVLGSDSAGSETATTETKGTITGPGAVIEYGTFKGAPETTGHYVSVGKTGSERQIKHVAAGAVNANSTDAINGSQLYATNLTLGNLAGTVKNKLGGNAVLKPDGSIEMTNIANTGKDNIHDAIIAARTIVTSEDKSVTVTPKEENGRFTYDLSVKAVSGDKTVVAAGKNVTVDTDSTTVSGTTTYTVNAEKTTASAGSNAVTVVAGTKDANNVTNYTIDLSQTTKDKIDKAVTDSQVRETVVAGSSGNVTVVEAKNLNSTGGKEFVVDIAKDLNLTKDGSVTIGDTQINNDGLTINNGPSVTKDGIDAGGKKITNVVAGEADTDAVNVKQLKEAKTEVVAGTNVTVDSKKGDNGQTIYTVNAEKTTASAGSDAVTVAAGTKDANNVTNYTIDLSQTTKDKIDKAVTDSQVRETVVAGSSGNVTVVEAKNLNSTGGKEFVVDIAKDLNLTKDGSVTIGDTKINNDGLTITDGPSVTKDGIDAGGKKITNVVAGEADTDAVNVKQLKEAKTEVVAGTNVTVDSKKGDNGQTIYTVNAEKTTASAGSDAVTVVAGTKDANNVTNYTIDLSQTTKDKIDKAVTDSQVRETVVAGSSGNVTVVEAKNLNSTGGKEFIVDIADQVTLGAKDGENGSLTVNGKDGSVVAIDGTDGKITSVGKDGNGVAIDGADGSITAVGKDGTGVVINGKDGSIGLAGKDGAGANISVKNGEDGKVGLDGTDGSSRIVYTDPDGKENSLATMNDGLRFTGNNETTLNKHKLNTTVKVVGERTADNNKTSYGEGESAANNIIVEANGTDTLTVKLAKDLTNLNSISNGKEGNSETKITLGNKSVSFGGSQLTNVASGLGDKKLEDLKDGDSTLTNGANIGDLQNLSKDLTTKGLTFTADDYDENNEDTKVHRDLGTTLQIVGDGNITTSADKNNAQIKVGLSDNVELGKDGENGSLTVNGKDGSVVAIDGTDGKITSVGKDGNGVAIDGTDGSISAVGKDGTGVVINGKDGSIGLAGKDGASANISVKNGEDGKVGLDGTDGSSRIVYTDPNGTENSLATMNDGLKYSGDDGLTDKTKIIGKKLNEQLDIVGGADKNNLTDKNIGVNNINGQLKVQLAKDLDLTDEGSVKIGNTVADKDGLTTENTDTKTIVGPNGITIAPKADNKDTVSLTDKGLDNGNNQIKNVASGASEEENGKPVYNNLTNGANIGDIKNIVEANKTILVDGKNTIVKGEGTKEKPYQVDVADQVTLGVKDGADGKNGIDGSIGVNGKDGSSVVINGKDGSIGLNGKDGSNGLTIKGDKGADGVDGANGADGKTRIVYETVNPDGSKTKEEVATLNDGLKFTGNNETILNKHKLNTTVKVVGERTDTRTSYTEAESAANNIIVEANGNDQLTVKISKDLDLTDKGSVKMGDTTVNNSGLTINNGPSVTKDGVDAGGKKITNVAPGTDPTDAVNVSQLNQHSTNINNRINNLDDKVNRGLAGAAAMAGLEFMEIGINQATVAAAVGGYKGTQAVAVGLQAAPTENTRVNAKVSMTPGSNVESLYSVGAAYRFNWK